MKIFVNVKPRSHFERIEEEDKQHYTIRVKQPPIDDKANEAVVMLLAKHLSVPRNHVRLISGRSSRHKVFEILSVTSPPRR